MVKQYKVPASVKKAMIKKLIATRKRYAAQLLKNPKKAIIRKTDIIDINKGLSFIRKNDWKGVIRIMSTLDSEPRDFGWPSSIYWMDEEDKYLVKSASKKTTTKKRKAPAKKKTTAPKRKVKRGYKVIPIKTKGGIIYRTVKKSPAKKKTTTNKRKAPAKKKTTKKVRRQRKTAKPAGKIKGKKPIYRKKRPSPQLSATSVKIGTRRKGGDGKMYVCKGYKRQGKTIKRWIKA
jgi:hypothetical protein